MRDNLTYTYAAAIYLTGSSSAIDTMLAGQWDRVKCPGSVAGQRYVGTFMIFSQLGGVFEQKSSCENSPRCIQVIWLAEALSLRGCNGQQSVVASGGYVHTLRLRQGDVNQHIRDYSRRYARRLRHFSYPAW